MILTLPFPPAALSPNSRAHRMEKARFAAKYRNDCFFLTKHVMAGRPVTPPDGDIPVKITWHPKTKNLPDMDNAIASMKSGLDGIARALMVDDKRFRLTWELAAPVKGGKVIVTLGALA